MITPQQIAQINSERLGESLVNLAGRSGVSICRELGRPVTWSTLKARE
jgi:hypothetical protein